jgi:hypothetical protein
MMCGRLLSNLVEMGRRALVRRLISLLNISAAFRSATEALSDSQTIASLKSTIRPAPEPAPTAVTPLKKASNKMKSLKQGMPLLVMLSCINLKRFRNGLI